MLAVPEILRKHVLTQIHRDDVEILGVSPGLRCPSFFTMAEFIHPVGACLGRADDPPDGEAEVHYLPQCERPLSPRVPAVAADTAEGDHYRLAVEDLGDTIERNLTVDEQ